MEYRRYCINLGLVRDSEWKFLKNTFIVCLIRNLVHSRTLRFDLRDFGVKLMFSVCLFVLEKILYIGATALFCQNGEYLQCKINTVSIVYLPKLLTLVLY